jgi:lipopolysaccharide export system permease protein
MRILTRYILAELTKVFLLSLTALTGMFCIILVVDEALDKGLPPTQLLRLTPYILPEALVFAVPATLLLATTTVYSRISGSNEVVAIKSLGLSPMVLVWPALVMAFLLSLGTVVLYDVAVSWGRAGVERVIKDAVEEIAYGMLRTQGQFSWRDFDITVREVQGDRLIGPTLSLKPRGNTPASTITAEEAILRTDHQNNALKIIICDGTFLLEGGMEGRFPDQRVYEFPLGDPSQTDITSKSPSDLPMRVIPGEKARQTADIERCQQQLAGRAAYQMLCGDFDGLLSPEWDNRHKSLKNKRSRLHRLRTEPYRRWSAGFSCLCFVMVGAPMAIRLRNAQALTSFFLCFLPILVVYYPALAYTVDAAKGGVFPPFAVWAGNGILLLWGGWLLRKVRRY